MQQINTTSYTVNAVIDVKQCPKSGVLVTWVEFLVAAPNAIVAHGGDQPRTQVQRRCELLRDGREWAIE